MDREQTIDRLWESSNHGTRREDVVAAFEAGVAAEREQMRALIAAAPALLEALQDTFAMLDESLLRDTFGSDWVQKARAAIAAATAQAGEQHG